MAGVLAIPKLMNRHSEGGRPVCDRDACAMCDVRSSRALHAHASVSLNRSHRWRTAVTTRAGTEASHRADRDADRTRNVHHHPAAIASI